MRSFSDIAPDENTLALIFPFSIKKKKEETRLKESREKNEGKISLSLVCQGYGRENVLVNAKNEFSLMGKWKHKEGTREERLYLTIGAGQFH